MRQIPKRDAQIQAVVLELPVTPEQDKKNERDQHSRGTPKYLHPCASKEAQFPRPASRRLDDQGRREKRESQIGQFEGLKAWYLEPNRIRQQWEKYECSNQNVEQTHM